VGVRSNQSLGATMDKQEIQEKIRYSSISYAREHGIISKEEAEFMLDEYVKEYKDAHPRPEK
jgi:chromosome condensin MukBEF MukE localization factor